jgi:hypothetical protein
MKIIIVSRGDQRRWHTLKLLHGEIDATVVVHTEKLARSMRKEFPDFKIVASNTTKLVDKRNWILKKLVKKNEWYIGMDDNIRAFTAVRKPWRDMPTNETTKPPPRREGYKTWREIYNHEVPFDLWLELFKDDMQCAELNDIPLVGVATMENPFMRVKRYSNYRFVKTKVYAMKNTGRLYFENDISHDSWLTALCIAVHGKVLVDSYLHHKVKMYEPGGLGTREEREAKGLLKFMKHTIDTFPGLVTYGHGKNTALRMCLTNENSVERWREEHGYA